MKKLKDKIKQKNVERKWQEGWRSPAIARPAADGWIGPVRVVA